MATKPIFLVGDTAWKLWRATNADMDSYLDSRAAQGFDYVQVNGMFDVANDLAANQNRDGITASGGQLVDSGTASAISATTVTLQSGHTFATNALAGYQLRINSAGANADQARTIASNTNANPSVVTLSGASWSDGTPTGTIQYGIAKPYVDAASARFPEAWMQVLDRIVDQANARGMYVFLCTMWGGDFFFLCPTTAIATALGQWFGDRYKNKKVAFLGLGEYHEGGTLTTDQLDRANAFLDGLESVAPNILKTMHPDGSRSSSDFAFHNLDFNGCQTYQIASNTATDIADDWAKTPVKPCGDLEPGYETSTRESGAVTIDGYYCRYQMWHAITSGAAYYTYGHNDVWQWINSPLTKLTADGALAAPIAKRIMESRWLGGTPTQGLISSPGTYASTNHPNNLWMGLLAPLANSAIIYVPSGAGAKTINLNLLTGSGNTVNAWWVDPQTMICYDQSNATTNSPARVLTSKVATSFTPPSSGHDWLLILDDAAAGFVKPGSAYTL